MSSAITEKVGGTATVVMASQEKADSTASYTSAKEEVDAKIKSDGIQKKNGRKERRNRGGGRNRNRNSNRQNTDNLQRDNEEQKKPAERVVLAKGLKGRVAWYSVRECYGFITRDDGGEDVFVHQLNILKSYIYKQRYRSLAENEEVQFDLAEGRRGRNEAVNVTGPGGKNVQGTSILIRYIGNRPQVVGLDEDMGFVRSRYSPRRFNRGNRKHRGGGYKGEAEKKAAIIKEGDIKDAPKAVESEAKLSVTPSSSVSNIDKERAKPKEKVQPLQESVKRETVSQKIAKWTNVGGAKKNGTAAGDAVDNKA